jgi:hypothetical protein
MIATAHHDRYEATLAASGWTSIRPLGGDELGSHTRTRTWYKVAGASEPSSYTFTFTGAPDNAMSAHIIAFAPPGGGGGTWVLEDDSWKVDNTDTNASITTTSVNGVVDGLLYAAYGNDEAHAVSTAPTGMTEDHVTSQDGLALATYFGCTSSTDPVTKSITWDAATGELTAIAAVFSYNTTTDLALGDHTSGQASDAFVVSTPVTDVLFRFTLDPTGSVTVTQLDVNYTTSGGVVDGDIDQGALWQDDGDGVWESGQDTQIQASVSGSGGQLSFTTDFSPPAAETGGGDGLFRARAGRQFGGR